MLLILFSLAFFLGSVALGAALPVAAAWALGGLVVGYVANVILNIIFLER